MRHIWFKINPEWVAKQNETKEKIYKTIISNNNNNNNNVNRVASLEIAGENGEKKKQVLHIYIGAAMQANSIHTLSVSTSTEWNAHMK